MRKYKKIQWYDHFSDSRWKSKEEIAEWASKPSICTTVGEVTYEDNDIIVLSASSDGEENYGEHMAIFKKNII